MMMTHKKSMGPVSIAAKSLLKGRSGLVVNPINYTKPTVLQGQNPNLRPLLPKAEEVVSCRVCKQEMKGDLLPFHMNQAHKGATIPSAVTVAPKVVGNISMSQTDFCLLRWP